MNQQKPDRLEILVLDRRNGVISSEYIDVQSLLKYLERSGNIHRFNILVRKGEKAIYFDKIEPRELSTKIQEFQNQNP